jgi:2-methylisocitrate lyase-like PEP mutase family enzyme
MSSAHARQVELARAFAALHVRGAPLVLYNVWDPGSARAVRDAGARAIATGSWSVAAANGFEDGEQIPLDLVADIIRRIAASVDVPVTLDFESGYSRGGRELAENVRRIIDAGAVGINFEDQQVGEDAMYSIHEQRARIETVRSAATSSGVPLFINARTDLFLRADQPAHAAQINEAIERAAAYAQAGASGLFVPGLRDESLIRRICDATALPVNVMYHPELAPRSRLGELGVARISYGPRPYRDMIARLTEAATAAQRSD